METAREYPKYKFVALVLFSLLSMMNAMMWCTFMPITVYTIQIVQITNLQVYFLGLVFMIAYPFSYFFANYALDAKGLRFGLHIGTALTLAGALVRCLGYYGYVPLLVGQLLASIGQPFILNAPTKLINEWFEPKLRPLYISIAGSANNIGISIGFLIPIAFVNPGHITKADVLYLLITEAAIVSAISILQFIFFRVSPYKELIPNAKLFDCQPYKKLCKNKNYLLLFIASSTNVANFQTFSTVIEALILPFGFTSKHSSILGFVLLFGGVVESILIGIVTNRTKKYKIIFIACTALCLGVLAGLYFIMMTRKLYLLVISIILISPGTVYIVPLAMDYVQLLSPDVGESTSCGAVMALAQMISVVQITICDKLQSTYSGSLHSVYMICVMVACTIVGLILPIFERSSATVFKINTSVNVSFSPN
jgi:MFS family permease